MACETKAWKPVSNAHSYWLLTSGVCSLVSVLSIIFHQFCIMVLFLCSSCLFIFIEFYFKQLHPECLSLLSHTSRHHCHPGILPEQVLQITSSYSKQEHTLFREISFTADNYWCGMVFHFFIGLCLRRPWADNCSVPGALWGYRRLISKIHPISGQCLPEATTICCLTP